MSTYEYIEKLNLVFLWLSAESETKQLIFFLL